MTIERTAALAPGIGPPERIELGDLVIRRWQPEDLTARLEAVTVSFDHIHAWMGWLAEPTTLAKQQEFSAVVASWPTADRGFNYGIFDTAGELLGAIGLHDRLGPAAVEIGYWCHVNHTGRGVMTRAAGALTDIALTLPDIERVEIHCDEGNHRSAAIPRRLGFRHARTTSRDKRAPAETGRVMHWVKQVV
ncbi:GNAT family N-acetyltransferase [Nocardia sp. NPDC004722]